MTDQSLSDQLFSRGALMGVHIGRWGAMKKMNPEDMLLRDVDPGTLYLGHKKLLPKKAMEKFIEIEGKARRTLADHSIEFPIANARFVTYAAMPTIVSELEQLKQEWETELNSLYESYPAFRDEQLSLLEKQAQVFIAEERKKIPIGDKDFEEKTKQLDTWLDAQKVANRHAYPSKDDLRKKFSFTWRMFRISAMDGVNELDAQEVIRAQERLKADLQEWVRAAASSIHQTLGEAAQNAKELLEKNGKLTPRNLKPLFEAFENFVAVDFTGKSTFRETIEEIKSKFLIKYPDGEYDLTATSTSISDSKTQFESLLKSVSELSLGDIATKAGADSLRTEFGRNIDL